MGIIKTCKVGGKDVQVRTLTFGDMLKLTREVNLNTMLWSTLRPDDQSFLDELEFTPELNKDYEQLIKAFLEVNPHLTKKAEEKADFLQAKKPETTGASSSGSPENSTGPLTK